MDATEREGSAGLPTYPMNSGGGIGLGWDKRARQRSAMWRDIQEGGTGDRVAVGMEQRENREHKTKGPFSHSRCLASARVMALFVSAAPSEAGS